MKVYQFLYNYCIHESGPVTMGLYFNKRDAYKAMQEHRLNEFSHWLNLSKFFRKSIKFGNHEHWCIQEIEIHGEPPINKLFHLHKPIFALTTFINNQQFIMANINLIVGTNSIGIFTLLDANLNPIQGVNFSNQALGTNSNPEFATFAFDPTHPNNVIATPIAAGSGTLGISTDATYNDPLSGLPITASFSVTKNFTVVQTSKVTFDVIFN